MHRLLLIIRVLTCIYVVFIAGVIVCATNDWFDPEFERVKQVASDKLLHFLLVGLLAFLIKRDAVRECSRDIDCVGDIYRCVVPFESFQLR